MQSVRVSFLSAAKWRRDQVLAQRPGPERPLSGFDGRRRSPDQRQWFAVALDALHCRLLRQLRRGDGFEREAHFVSHLITVLEDALEGRKVVELDTSDSQLLPQLPDRSGVGWFAVLNRTAGRKPDSLVSGLIAPIDEQEII
mgnify:FL=1